MAIRLMLDTRSDGRYSTPAAVGRCRTTFQRLPQGEFSLRESISCERGTFGFLLLEGLLLRGVSVDARPSVDVLGAGDLIHPGQRHSDETVPVDVRWWALRPARLAVLDPSFICRMSDYPGVLGAVAGRLGRASEASGLQLSIVQQPLDRPNC